MRPRCKAISLPGFAIFGGPGGPRASVRHDTGLLQVGKTLQIVGSGLPVQMQRGARQANRAQHLAAQLGQTGEDVLHAGARLGDVVVAPLLRLGQRLVLAALRWMCMRQPCLFRRASRSLST